MTAPLHRHGRIGSTQDACFALAGEGAEAGTVVVAAEQEGGRGSRGQRWSSPVGGLWLSILYRPQLAPSPELLSLRAGLAVADALEQVGGLPPVRLKWPNDLIVADRKAGGILCEAHWNGPALAALVVGVGINVTNPVPADARVPALALAEWRRDLTPEHLIGPVVARLRALDPSLPELARAELAAFADRDWLEGRTLVAPVAGDAAGIGADGALRVRRPDGTLTSLRAGPVVLAPETAAARG